MRLQPLSARRCHAILVIAMVFAVLPCSIATAGPILLKFDVAFLEPGAPSRIDLGIAVTGAVEINNAGGTNVGAPFFDDEFIDITSDASMTSLAYMLQGGLNPHSDADYSTSWPTGSAILFANFVLDQPGTLDSVGVTVDQANGVARIVGAGGGSLVSGVDYIVNGFTPNTLQLNLGQLGILDQPGQTPLGLMRFQLNFVAKPQVTVPEPASTLTLFGMGMAALAARRRLARRR